MGEGSTSVHTEVHTVGEGSTSVHTEVHTVGKGSTSVFTRFTQWVKVLLQYS